MSSKERADHPVVILEENKLSVSSRQRPQDTHLSLNKVGFIDSWPIGENIYHGELWVIQ